MTRPQWQVDEVLRLRGLGVAADQISSKVGIPQGTVRSWLWPKAPRKPTPVCFRCGDAPLEQPRAYVYLLGLYLGDGYLVPFPRDVWHLRIFQDQKYPGLIAGCGEAMHAVSGRRIGGMKQIGCVVIACYWKHWIHVFPHHGAGLKWQRRIQMEPWQQALIETYPDELLRGLIHSDGSRFANTVTRRFAGRIVRYSYPRYMFANRSDDIRSLFIEACERVGVRWTQTNERNVAVSRREDVALLDTFIGPKC